MCNYLIIHLLKKHNQSPLIMLSPRLELFKKAINVKSLDNLNKQQLDQLAKILKNVKY